MPPHRKGAGLRPAGQPRAAVPTSPVQSSAADSFCFNRSALMVLFQICAEVVELADTPSARIALAILYNLLIINLMPFASITCGDIPPNGQ
jgi:hypothetical protein